jgi:hypothetical protein
VAKGSKGTKGATGKGTVNGFASMGGGRTTGGRAPTSNTVKAVPVRQGQGSARKGGKTK